jgi:hypothetical protein
MWRSKVRCSYIVPFGKSITKCVYFLFQKLMWQIMNKACFHYSAQSFINQHQTCPSGVSNHGAAVNWAAPS